MNILSPRIVRGLNYLTHIRGKEMNKWSVHQDTQDLSWAISKNGSPHGKYPAGNGSTQSGRLQCLRELATNLISERFNDQPEKAYSTAQFIIDVAEHSGLVITIDAPADLTTQIYT